MYSLLNRLGADLLHIIAPALCVSCDTLLEPTERFYCLECRSSLEPAPFPREIFTEIAGRFSRDELAISAAASLYAFHHDSPVQKLIHALKYKGCYGLGVEMGRELATALQMFPEFDDIQLVVPVPLHRAKLRERGYNQAEAIARGITAGIRGSRLEHPLVRRHHSVSQTTLGAVARRGNVRDIFRTTGNKVRGCTLLLCDDVCTTGATLNACAEQLLQAGAHRVLAATVAKDMPRETPTDITALVRQQREF